MELSFSIYISLLQAIYTLFAWTSYAAAHQERKNMWTENCLHGLKFYGTENPDFCVSLSSVIHEYAMPIILVVSVPPLSSLRKKSNKKEI